MATIHDQPNYLAVGGSLNGGWQYGSATVQTTDATATDIARIPVAEDEMCTVEVTLSAAIDDYSAGIGGSVIHRFRRAAAGNVTAIGSATNTAANDSAGTPTIQVVASTGDQQIDIRVTGIAAETWNWEVHYRYLKV